MLALALSFSSIGVAPEAYAGLHETQSIDRNYAVFEHDGEAHILTDIENESGLMMRHRVGRERIIDTSDNRERKALFVRRDLGSPFDIFPTRISPQAPRCGSDVVGKCFGWEKSKPHSEWLSADLRASDLLFLQWGWAAIFENNKPSMGSDVDGRTVSDVRNFERNRNTRSILINGEAAAAKTYLVNSYPCTLTGDQSLLSNSGGLYCPIGGNLSGIGRFGCNIVSTQQKSNLDESDEGKNASENGQPERIASHGIFCLFRRREIAGFGLGFFGAGALLCLWLLK